MDGIKEDGFGKKLVRNKAGSSESPRFGMTRDNSQDSFTTQCSTPRSHNKHQHPYNNLVINTSVGYAIPEANYNGYVDSFDEIMSQTLQHEQLSNSVDNFINTEARWNGFIGSLPQSIQVTPKAHHLSRIGQIESELGNIDAFQNSDYPLLSSALTRDWDRILNLSTQEITASSNDFKWWCNEPPLQSTNSTNTNDCNFSSGNKYIGTTSLKKLEPKEVNGMDMGINTNLTSTSMDASDNCLKIMSQINDQYHQRIKHIVNQNDGVSKQNSSLAIGDGEGKEFVAAVREHLIKVHQQMEKLMLDNNKLQDKIDKSTFIVNKLTDTFGLFKEQVNVLVQENYKLIKELKIARQDKAYAVEYCRSSNEALKQTNLEKDKILIEFNNIANSKVVLEREFKETILNMQNMKSKLIEWQSKVNSVSPKNKSVRFSEYSDLHIVNSCESQPIAPLSHSILPTICKSVQEQLQTYQLNCNN